MRKNKYILRLTDLSDNHLNMLMDIVASQVGDMRDFTLGTCEDGFVLTDIEWNDKE